jgi:hypothetical protein
VTPERATLDELIASTDARARDCVRLEARAANITSTACSV